MRKDKVVLDREEYNNLVGYRDSTVEYLTEKKGEYLHKYCEELKKNAQLEGENGHLKALFDKEADTQVIKYNGKLYKIVSATNYIEGGVEETLDVSLVPVREVG